MSSSRQGQLMAVLMDLILEEEKIDLEVLDWFAELGRDLRIGLPWIDSAANYSGPVGELRYAIGHPRGMHVGNVAPVNVQSEVYENPFPDLREGYYWRWGAYDPFVGTKPFRHVEGVTRTREEAKSCADAALRRWGWALMA